MDKSRKSLIVGGLVAVVVAGLAAFGANTSLFKGAVTFTPMTLTEVTPADGSFLTETTEFSVVTNVSAICSYRAVRSDRGYPLARKMLMTELEDGSFRHSITVRMHPSRSMNVRRYIKCSDYYVNVKQEVLNLTVAPTPVITEVEPTHIENDVSFITVTGRNFDSLVENPNSDAPIDNLINAYFDDYETDAQYISDTEIIVYVVAVIPQSSRLTLRNVAHPETYYATTNEIITRAPYPSETPAEPDRLTLTDVRPNGIVNSNRVLFQVNTDREADCTYRASANLSGSTQYPMAKSDFADGIQKHNITVNINGGDSETIYQRYLRCTDSTGDSAEAESMFTIDLPEVTDTNAPMVTVEKIGVLPIGTTGATLRANTDESATCTYKQMGLAASDTSNRMVSADMISHSANLLGLAAGKHAYQVTCVDGSENVSKPVPVEFEIKSDKSSTISNKKFAN